MTIVLKIYTPPNETSGYAADAVDFFSDEKVFT